MAAYRFITVLGRIVGALLLIYLSTAFGFGLNGSQFVLFF